MNLAILLNFSSCLIIKEKLTENHTQKNWVEWPYSEVTKFHHQLQGQRIAHHQYHSILNRSHQTNVITSLTDQKQEVFLQSFLVFFLKNTQKKIWFWIPILTKCSVDLQCGHLRNLAKNGKSSLTPRLFVQSKCLHAGYPDIWGSSEILTGSVKPNPRALSTQASAS